MKTPRETKKYNVHICTTDGLQSMERNTLVKVISYVTPHYNLPYRIAKFKRDIIGKTKTTFPIALPVGIEPMKYFADQRLKL